MKRNHLFNFTGKTHLKSQKSDKVFECGSEIPDNQSHWKSRGCLNHCKNPVCQTLHLHSIGSSESGGKTGETPEGTTQPLAMADTGHPQRTGEMF